MAEKRYQGLTLLGSSGQERPKSPDEAKLETFENAYPAREYTVRFD